jgi:hypothetical protein
MVIHPPKNSFNKLNYKYLIQECVEKRKEQFGRIEKRKFYPLDFGSGY